MQKGAPTETKIRESDFTSAFTKKSVKNFQSRCTTQESEIMQPLLKLP